MYSPPDTHFKYHHINPTLERLNTAREQFSSAVAEIPSRLASTPQPQTQPSLAIILSPTLPPDCQHETTILEKKQPAVTAQSPVSTISIPPQQNTYRRPPTSAALAQPLATSLLVQPLVVADDLRHKRQVRGPDSTSSTLLDAGTVQSEAPVKRMKIVGSGRCGPPSSYFQLTHSHLACQS